MRPDERPDVSIDRTQDDDLSVPDRVAGSDTPHQRIEAGTESEGLLSYFKPRGATPKVGTASTGKLTRRQVFEHAIKYGPRVVAAAAGLDLLATLPADSPLGTLDTCEPVGKTPWSMIYSLHSRVSGRDTYASLFVDRPANPRAMSPADVSQSTITGDCGLEALLVAISVFQEDLMLQNMTDNGHGVFGVTLYHSLAEPPGRKDIQFLGLAIPEIFSVSLAEIKGPLHAKFVYKPYFIKDGAGHRNISLIAPIWPLVAEAAMAQYLGSGDQQLGFQILNRGTLNEGVERMAFALTGRKFVGKGFSVDIEDESETLRAAIPNNDPVPSWPEIQRTVERSGIMILGTKSALSDDRSHSVPDWFVNRHFFAVVGCREDKQTGERMVDIVNPWGVRAFKDGINWWTSVPYADLKRFFLCSVFEAQE